MCWASWEQAKLIIENASDKMTPEIALSYLQTLLNAKVTVNIDLAYYLVDQCGNDIPKTEFFKMAMAENNLALFEHLYPLLVSRGTLVNAFAIVRDLLVYFDMMSKRCLFHPHPQPHHISVSEPILCIKFQSTLLSASSVICHRLYDSFSFSLFHTFSHTHSQLTLLSLSPEDPTPSLISSHCGSIRDFKVQSPQFNFDFYSPHPASLRPRVHNFIVPLHPPMRTLIRSFMGDRG